MKASSKQIFSYPNFSTKGDGHHLTENANGAQRVNRSVGDLRAPSTKTWGWLHVMQITIQRTRPAWLQKQN